MTASFYTDIFFDLTPKNMILKLKREKTILPSFILNPGSAEP